MNWLTTDCRARCFSQGLGFENGGFLIAVDDVVHPTAQGIDGVNRSALVEALKEE